MPIKDCLPNRCILPVVTFTELSQAVPVAEALLAGGINQIEITLRTDIALDAIRQLAEKVPEMQVSAGTVVNVDSLDAAKSAGAKFALSPGFDASLVQHAQSIGFPFIPAVSTASEVMAAQNLGIELVKVFPASVLGGVAVLKAWRGPFPNMRYCPTGGVNINNLSEFLDVPEVDAVGGSWLVTTDDLKNQNWAEITERSKQAMKIISG